MRTNEGKLVRQTLASRHDAFAELVDRYRDATCAIAYSHLGNWEDVQDAAQEAFVQAYTRLGQLRNAEKFGPWLRRITTNVCADMLRRSGRTTVSLNDVEELAMPNSEADLQRAATRMVIRDALDLLPEKARLTATLFYINGYSHAEIAEFLEVPVNTVRSRLQSAKKRLSQEMITMVTNVLNEEKKKVRIRNPHVTQYELIEDTGVEELDDFLYALVNVLGIGLGEYLRSIFFVKTYASENFAPLCFVFKDGHDSVHGMRLWSLADHLMCLSKYGYLADPLYRGNEGPFYDPDDFGDPNGYPCGPVLKLAVKEHSLLLWGEDIRPRIALCRDRDLYLKDVLIPPFSWIKQTHNDKEGGPHPLDTKIVYPLSDPDPRKEDRGFGNPLHVSHRTFHIARALIYLEAGELVLEQREIADAYEQHVGTPWEGLVREVSEARFGGGAEREKRRKWLSACRQMTAFENYLLERLAAKGVDVSADVGAD